VSWPAITDVVCERLTPQAGRWLREALLGPRDDDELVAGWNGAGRRLGRAPLVLSAAERERLSNAPFVPEGGGRTSAGGR
jgi:hypothetical protein